MYTITITTESRSVHEYLLDELDTMALHPKPTIVSDMGYAAAEADTESAPEFPPAVQAIIDRIRDAAVTPDRIYDALRAAGEKALADEFADANGAGR
jgi:hypothetical protein